MFRKYFKVDLVTIDSQRIIVHVEANDVKEVVARMKGTRYTFIPRTKEDKHSFTVYAQTLARITYEVISDAGFGKFLVYDIISD